MNRRLSKALAIFLGAGCVGSVICYFLFACPGIATSLNNLVYDTWLISREPVPASAQVAVVDLDEKSLKNYGQLPWPRSILADLVSTLLIDGVTAIGLDIWLTEADRSSPVVVDSLLEKNFGLNLDLANIPPAAQDNDRYFRNVIQGKPVILGAYASYDGASSIPGDLPTSINLKANPNANMANVRLATAKNLIPPLPIFTADAPVGVLGFFTDTDGLVRTAPLLTQAGDKIYPSLALRTLMAARQEKDLKLNGDKNGLESLTVADIDIPVEKDASFHPVYLGGDHTIPYFSAFDVMEGNVGRKELENKIVFVGTSAHTLLNLRSTPFDPEVPDAEIHATIVDNMLTGVNIRTPGNAWAIQIFAIYLSALLAVSAFSLLSMPIYVILAIFLLALYFFLSWLLFQNGLFLSPAGPVFALLLAGVCIIPLRFWHEYSEKNKLKLAFGRYVAPEIVSQIITGGERLLKGEQKEATIMFTDVRDFTAISEKLSPPELVRLLNCYFTPMTACVTAHHGTLDKFIGDALMAFWNAPVNVPDHAAEAVWAALDMQAALGRMRPELMRDFGINMRIGIGINTGLVHVGNMGSNDLLDYTCIGEMVNLASRLEGMCKHYGVDIVVSASVRQACASIFNFLLLDKISVKGSLKPVAIYTPLTPARAIAPSLETRWNSALSAYFAGDFQSAFKEFQSLQGDAFLHTAATLFANRCLELEQGPLESWTGIWNYKSK